MKYEAPRRHGPFDPRYQARRHPVEPILKRRTGLAAAKTASDEPLLVAVGTWESEGGAASS